jgi:hypothetical protein
MGDITKWEQPKQSKPPREIKITLPRLPEIPRDKVPMIIAIASGFVSFLVVNHLLSQINDLKKQQDSAEERIKEEVLMPGGTNSYKTEFKPDPNVDTAKDPVVEVAPAPAPAVVAPEPAPVPVPAPVVAPPAPARGPGNLDSDYSPSYGSGASGPGNM